MRKTFWVVLVAAVTLTLVLAPSAEPAVPEPGVRRVLATVFGEDE